MRRPARGWPPPLAGIVDFGYRKVQAEMNEVAAAATVSLIDAGANRTIATTVTDDTGRFLLDNFGAGFVPGTKAYYLEAVKGLSSNVAGVPAVRVRTIARFSGGWSSITSPTWWSAVTYAPTRPTRPPRPS